MEEKDNNTKGVEEESHNIRKEQIQEKHDIKEKIKEYVKKRK